MFNLKMITFHFQFSLKANKTVFLFFPLNPFVKQNKLFKIRILNTKKKLDTVVIKTFLFVF